MYPKKRRSTFSVFFALFTVVAILLGMIDALIYIRYYRSGWYKSRLTPAEKIDMTVAEDKAEYGRLYYAPAEDEHIIEAEEEEWAGYIDNEVLIVACDGVAREQIDELAASYNAEVIGEISVTGDYQLRLTTAPDELDAVVESISAEPVVASASLNYVADYTGTAADVGNFYYGSEWDGEFKRYPPAFNKAWGFTKINTPLAWNELYMNSSAVTPVKVGVLDVGFSPDHPDLGFAQFFYDNGANGENTAEKSKEHGTHVSGTFAANADDSTGICGVYPYGRGNLYGASLSGVTNKKENGKFRKSVMSLKVAFGELIIRNAKVINFSIGFNYRSNDFTYFDLFVDRKGLIDLFNDPSAHTATAAQAKLLGDFFDRLLKTGYDFVLCASAGNDSDDTTGHLEAKYNSPLTLIEQTDYPDVYDRIIVVGSLNQDSSFSSGVSVSSFSNGGARTDIYAPGGQIYSTYRENGKNKYAFLNGTSMATPHVSGVAAMVWSANNSLTGAQVKDMLLNNPNPCEKTLVTLDAYSPVCAALGIPNTLTAADSKDGALYGFVAGKGFLGFEGEVIEGADVTITGRTSKDSYTAVTDEFGHYEIIAPDDDYDIKISAKGFLEYKSDAPVKIKSCEITYLDKVLLKKDKDSSEKSLSTPKIGKIYTGEDINKYLPDEYRKYNYGIELVKVKAWTYYDGHFYGVFDRAVPTPVIGFITSKNANVHLVTINSEAEQKLVEELITYGEKDIYCTGGLVDNKGVMSYVNGEAVEYDHWRPGSPCIYVVEGLNDVMTVYRGSGDEPKSAPEFGYWLEFHENTKDYFNFDSKETSTLSRGIIVEWDVS